MKTPVALAILAMGLALWSCASVIGARDDAAIADLVARTLKAPNAADAERQASNLQDYVRSNAANIDVSRTGVLKIGKLLGSDERAVSSDAAVTLAMLGKKSAFMVARIVREMQYWDCVDYFAALDGRSDSEAYGRVTAAFLNRSTPYDDAVRALTSEKFWSEQSNAEMFVHSCRTKSGEPIAHSALSWSLSRAPGA